MNKNAHFGTITLVTLAAILFMSGCKKDGYNASQQPNLKIGDSYAGGNIFYIDATGQHGFVVATKDQSDNALWMAGPYIIVATSDDGFSNTQNIVSASQGSGPNAAKLCKDYRGDGYTELVFAIVRSTG